ncbi:MAG: hypothetical protein KDG50_02240 [Chromatiales bacterium]|nr:hypothetical protein [Chromatiales bacterium]
MNKRIGFVSLLMLLPGVVMAGASGKVEKEFFGEKNTITVTDGYAFNAPDVFDKTRQATVIFLSSQPIDRSGLDRARDRAEVIEDRLRDLGASYIELNITQENRELNSANFVFSGSGNLSTSGNTLGTITRLDAGQVAGSLTDSTVEFDLPIAPPPNLPKGKALGAGGGAPGKAYMASRAAIAAGDVDTMARYMNPDMAEMMLAARKEPDFKEQLGFLQEMNAGEVKIVSGEQFGTDEAILQMEGSMDGSAFTGEITMKLGPKGWYVEKESRSF